MTTVGGARTGAGPVAQGARLFLVDDEPIDEAPVDEV